MSEEDKKSSLPYDFPYLFQDFLVDTQIDFDIKDLVHLDYYELVEWLYINDSDTYNAFSEYLYEKVIHFNLNIESTDYPAWVHFDDDDVEIITNQWLIHFTDDALSVARDGFKYGVDDITKLGLTKHLGQYDKQYGGYNFAYLLKDFPRHAERNYTRGGGYKYGDEAVVFRASGIRVYHHSDNEPQVIFFGKYAKDIIPITEGDRKKFAIRDKKDRILYEGDLDKVVKWLTNNYNQYKKSF